jgi:glycosyltransferase involved in cell wall biosynthesis
MATVTLSMIVKNEEAYLRGCLESVQGTVDEIVIVDTGSTDRTLEIAKEFGAKIFSFPWTGNFSEARNESLSHCTSEWVLYLDADERLKEGSSNKLKALIHQIKPWAYTLLVQGKHYLPSGVVDMVNAYPRLFRRHPKIRFEGVVHEQITPSIQRLGKSIVPSDIVVYHLGYGESLEKVLEKSSRNISLLETQLERNRNDDYARYQLGNSYVVLQEYSKAEPFLHRVMSSPSLDKSIKASTCNLFVEIELDKKNIEKAEEWCRKSLVFMPMQTMAKWFLSGILAHQMKYKESLQILLKLMKNTTPSTGLAHDTVVPLNELQARILYCYEMLANDAVTQFDLIQAEKWILAAEGENLRSLGLEKLGVEVSLAKRDLPGAYPRLKFLIEHLPPTADVQRAKFSEIKSKLEEMASFELYQL